MIRHLLLRTAFVAVLAVGPSLASTHSGHAHPTHERAGMHDVIELAMAGQWASFVAALLGLRP